MSGRRKLPQNPTPGSGPVSRVELAGPLLSVPRAEPLRMSAAEVAGWRVSKSDLDSGEHVGTEVPYKESGDRAGTCTELGESRDVRVLGYMVGTSRHMGDRHTRKPEWQAAATAGVHSGVEWSRTAGTRLLVGLALRVDGQWGEGSSLPPNRQAYSYSRESPASRDELLTCEGYR